MATQSIYKCPTKEWRTDKKWNPFNSYKLLAHIERWRHIHKGLPLPPPVLVTIDPTNSCNLSCIWCNSKPVIRSRQRHLSKIAIKTISGILERWQSIRPFGLKAVCIAGGGEPLLNRNTGILIESLAQVGIDIGVVTNGILIHKFIPALSTCHWVAVSIDAATPETFSRLKGGHRSYFDKIIRNITKLIEYANIHNSHLANSALSFGVTYKFLLHGENINEIVSAAKLAKSIGCRSIQIRPAGTPWYDRLEDTQIRFTKDQIAAFHDQVNLAQQLDDDTFSVYGLTHKFKEDFQPHNNFKKCQAIFMTAVFMPPHMEDPVNSFVIGLCCDRRGDTQLELANNIADIDDAMNKWGSDEHWEMQRRIDLKSCPRCTYSPHNEIYEEVILKDNMSIEFI